MGGGAAAGGAGMAGTTAGRWWGTVALSVGAVGMSVAGGPSSPAMARGLRAAAEEGGGEVPGSEVGGEVDAEVGSGMAADEVDVVWAPRARVPLAAALVGSRSGFLLARGEDVRAYDAKGNPVGRPFGGAASWRGTRMVTSTRPGEATWGGAGAARGRGRPGGADRLGPSGGGPSWLGQDETQRLLGDGLGLSPGATSDLSDPEELDEDDARDSGGGLDVKDDEDGAPRGGDGHRHRPRGAGDAAGRDPGARGGTPPGDEASPAHLRVAATSEAAWIARGDGLWRYRFEGGRLDRVDVDGNEAREAPVFGVAASVDGSHLVVAAGGRVHRSDDAGKSWRAFASLSGPPVALVITSSGQLLVRDREGVRVTGPGATEARWIALEDSSSPWDEAMACGERFMVVAQRRMWELDAEADAAGAPTAPVSLPEGTARAVCGEDGTRIAYGERLWLSRDGGQHWIPRARAPGGPIEAARPVGHRLWVARGSEALRALDLDDLDELGKFGKFGKFELTVDPRANGARASVGDSVRVPSRFEPSITSRSPWWRVMLPRVSMVLDLRSTSAQRSMVGLMTATFSLDPAVFKLGRREHIFELEAQRRLAMAREAASTDRLDGATDELAAEERAALANVAEGRQP